MRSVLMEPLNRLHVAYCSRGRQANGQAHAKPFYISHPMVMNEHLWWPGVSDICAENVHIIIPLVIHVCARYRRNVIYDLADPPRKASRVLFSIFRMVFKSGNKLGVQDALAEVEYPSYQFWLDKMFESSYIY